LGKSTNTSRYGFEYGKADAYAVAFAIAALRLTLAALLVTRVRLPPTG